MPDWRKPKDYAYCDALTPAGWAFEFLRRNPAYQADYAQLRHLEKVLQAAHGPLLASQANWRRDPRAWVCDPPIGVGESLRDWMRRAALSDVRVIRQEWYQDFYGGRWGLVGDLPDPAQPADPPPEFRRLTSGWPVYPTADDVLHYYATDEEPPEVPRPPYVVAVFDLTIPIPRQVRKAREHLNRALADAKRDRALRPLKRRAPGNEKSLYQRYLRVLDAHVAGVSPAEIGAVLYGGAPYRDFNTKKAADLLEAARSSMAFGYRAIAFQGFDSD